MKGLVFTEFLDLVDHAFGEEVTDAVVAACPLASGGIYTSIGTYDAGELHVMVGALSERTGRTAEELQRAYGEALFSRFAVLHPDLFARHRDPFSLLEAVEDEIHVEVRKIYPDAELPSLRTSRPAPLTLVLRYRSGRNLPAFCEGLARGCLAHYGAAGEVTREDAADAEGAFSDVTVRLFS
jgi:hypothetical protein